MYSSIKSWSPKLPNSLGPASIKILLMFNLDILFIKSLELKESLFLLRFIKEISFMPLESFGRFVFEVTTTFFPGSLKKGADQFKLRLFENTYLSGWIKFSFAMILGVILGTYSSIYIANPILVYLKVSSKTLEKDKDN